MQRVDLRRMHDGGIVRLGETRTIMHEHHLVARYIDELVVLGLERADVEKAVLRELVKTEQPLSICLLGLAHRAVIVAGLIMDIELLENRINLLALVGALGEINAPLADLAVEE